MLDQIRRDIQSRLDELLSEVDRLRHALAALASRDSGSSASARSAAAPVAPKASARKPAGKAAGNSVNGTRTAPGATKAAILAALASAGDPMTAGEIADATGLGRATISTTLSRLAKAGEVDKADRGYTAKSEG
ncbi:MAG: MarR family transcriptional regulator [Solirubrobacteraceae bacterium]|jgi:DNA-binding transcriptional ArsR family regulator